MVSKACVVGTYQTKLEAIGRSPDVDLTVVVPPSWKEPGGDLVLERSHTNHYTLRAEQIRLNGRYHFHYYPQLGSIVEALRPDIVHLDEEPYSFVTLHGLRYAQAVGAKSLFFSWQNIARKYIAPFRMIERYVLGAADYALMGNAAAEDVWRSKGYTGPSEILPQFGVSLDLFQPKPQNATSADRFVIGSASRRLKFEKGVDLLMTAASRLSGNWFLRITGDGGERPQLEQLAIDLGIQDRVEFVGKIGSDAMRGFLHSLDVMVLPSRTMPTWKEQFGRVLIETMASEIPVIGSDSGEIPNVIGDAGFVFPEGDADALFVHLDRLQRSDALRMEFGRKGRQRVITHYTQEQIAAKTVDVYRAMLQ
ncbi:MAG: glycosyltransferase family 4 protein [Candidatus Promineifilaceae bacterium]